MADEATDQGAQAPEAKQFAPITSQEQFDSILSARLARQAASIRSEFGDVDQLRADAKVWQEQQEEAKTELQKATERAQKLESDLSAAKNAELRRSIADEAGLPAALAARVTGSTRAEMLEDAKALAAMLTPKEPESKTPDPTGVQNTTTPAPAGGVIASLFRQR